MEILGNGRYELRAPLGEDAVAATFEALDLRRRVPVVVQPFAASANLTPLAEAITALRRADIAGVALPQELVLTREPAPFAVFAAPAGGTLEAALRDGALQWARAAAIVSGCAAILAAVQRATGLTHRALTPASIWLTADGAPQILDFGRAALGPGEPVRRGRMLLEYRAPEQLDDAPGDARSDVFTLAVLLVELTTGAHPFSGTTAFQAAHRLTQTPPDLAELTRGMTPTLAREVATHVRRALAGNPAERPADAAAFAERLDYQRPLVGAPAPSRPPQPAAPAPPSPAAPRPIEDPTTILQLPNMRHLFPRRPAEAPPPADAAPPIASPVPADIPAPPPEPPPAPAARPTKPAPAIALEPLEPATVEGTLRDRAPRSAADATIPLAVLKDSRSPSPAADATIPLAVLKDIRSPAPGPAASSPVPGDRKTPADLVDRTERDLRPFDDEVTRAALRRPVPHPHADENTGTIAILRDRLPSAVPADTTMVLPEAPAAAPAVAVAVPPANALAASRVRTTLIALNVLCVLILAILLVVFL